MRLPTITLVTPSLNRAAFIEDAIQSVLDQDYPNLQYVIMDGGSTDGTVDVIRRYERHLHSWHSGPDGGMSAAVIEGFRRGDGEVLAWLNDDDTYEPNALATAGEAFVEDPRRVLVYGDYQLQHADGRIVPKPKVSYDFKVALYAYSMITQPSSFWTREAYEAVGGLNAELHFMADFDLYLRLGHRFGKERIHHIPRILSTFRLHPESKSVALKGRFPAEGRRVRRQFTNESRRMLRIKFLLYMLKVEWMFLTERGMLPLRKDRSKF